MIISDKWRSYELIDASGGERLERWGKYILVRPDPQVIFRSDRLNEKWERCDAHYIRSRKGGGEWALKNVPDEWEIGYGDMKFSLSPMGFKHTGLFPEQAANWDWAAGLIKNAGRSIRVLNLFAYTGAASVSAAKAGAFVCHCDASKGMVARAKKNAALSGVPNDRIRYIVDDCMKFIEREIRRGSKYDAIIADPPSYGRGAGGEVWQLEDMADTLVRKASALLSDKPLFFILNSYTSGLSPSSCGCLLELYAGSAFGSHAQCEELGLPITDKGFALPCGSTARMK